MSRIGPQMQRAIEIVRANPGCSKRFVGVQLHPACANGNNNGFGYAPINRAITAGLIRAERDAKRSLYRLFPVTP